MSRAPRGFDGAGDCCPPSGWERDRESIPSLEACSSRSDPRSLRPVLHAALPRTAHHKSQKPSRPAWLLLDGDVATVFRQNSAQRTTGEQVTIAHNKSIGIGLGTHEIARYQGGGVGHR